MPHKIHIMIVREATTLTSSILDDTSGSDSEWLAYELTFRNYLAYW